MCVLRRLRRVVVVCRCASLSQGGGRVLMCVAFAGSCRCGVVDASRCWVQGRRRWSLLVAGWCMRVMLLCFVLCILPLRFRTSISGRVGSGQPNTYRAKNQKKNRYFAFSAIPPWRRHIQPAMPPLFGGVFSNFRHTFSPWRRHGRYLITLISTKSH